MAEALVRRWHSEMKDGWIDLFEGTPREQKDVVIFVHGLQGSAQGTWGKLINFVGQVPPTNGCDLGVFEYRSPRIDAEGLDDVVSHLEPWYNAYVKGYRSVVWVAHSFGGIVVRAFLSKTYQLGNDAEGANRCAIMLAVPLQGSRVAAILSLLRLDRLNKKIATLKPGSPSLKKLQADFDQVVRDRTALGLPIAKFLMFYADGDRYVKKVDDGFQAGVDVGRGFLKGSHTSMKNPESISDSLVQNIAVEVWNALHSTDDGTAPDALERKVSAPAVVIEGSGPARLDITFRTDLLPDESSIYEVVRAIDEDSSNGTPVSIRWPDFNQSRFEECRLRRAHIKEDLRSLGVKDGPEMVTSVRIFDAGLRDAQRIRDLAWARLRPLLRGVGLNWGSSARREEMIRDFVAISNFYVLRSLYTIRLRGEEGVTWPAKFAERAFQSEALKIALGTQESFFSANVLLPELKDDIRIYAPESVMRRSYSFLGKLVAAEFTERYLIPQIEFALIGSTEVIEYASAKISFIGPLRNEVGEEVDGLDLLNASGEP